MFHRACSIYDQLTLKNIHVEVLDISSILRFLKYLSFGVLDLNVYLHSSCSHSRFCSILSVTIKNKSKTWNQEAFAKILKIQQYCCSSSLGDF